MTSTVEEEAALKCPYGSLLETLGKPHTLAILYSFGVDTTPIRFTKLQKSLEIQPKTLAARLQELISFGLLTRKSYNEIPPRVDYELTQKGRDLGPLFDRMRDWAEKYQASEKQRKDRSLQQGSEIRRSKQTLTSP